MVINSEKNILLNIINENMRNNCHELFRLQIRLLCDILCKLPLRIFLMFNVRLD